MRVEQSPTASFSEQLRADGELYAKQIGYLLANSRFYQAKLRDSGIESIEDAGDLGSIARLPFTEKDELRAACSEADPIGTQLAVSRDRIVRVFSTSGTTGTPSYIPLTANDLDNWVTVSSRSYAASGIGRGEAIVSTYNAGPFVAGAALGAFDRLGMCHIPVGTGNTDRLMTAIRLLKPTAAVMTPSYAAYLVEWSAERKFDLRGSSVKRLLVAGEPGGGEPAFRARLEAAWGVKVTEAMGIGDIGVSLWGECEEQCGMHFGAVGFVHVELVDPETDAPLAIEDGAEGELVMTHLRQEAAPLLRFRTRDHVQVWRSPCKCGRSSLRMRCIGRTDDMLILRGVNVFPSAIRQVVSEFAPAVSGLILVKPTTQGTRQEPPLPVAVELAQGKQAEPALAERIQTRLREVLVFAAAVELVPWGSIERSQYKSKLIQH
jgi:phenylacetate-CoA ligase